MTVRAWSDRLVGRIGDDIRRHVASDPENALEQHFGLMVAPSTSFVSRGDRGSCDGVSIINGGLILFRPTPSRRQNFTLTHELAHHLVATDEDCLSWLADQPEPGRLLEQLCDQMAAELLVTQELVAHVIGGGPPDADALLALFESSEASRSVCAVAFANKLPCDGFVVLVEERADSVFFAARTRDTRPYAWRGDELPPAHPLRRDPPPTKSRTWWPHPGGADRRQYFMSCTTSPGWSFAVFAEDNLFDVPGFHLPEATEEDRGYGGEISCPCGYRGTTRWWPCSNCGVPECPSCHECDCDRRARSERRVMCANGCASVLPHLIVDGLCPQCR